MFCKNCGKQIPDGSICDCQMQGNIQQFSQQPNYGQQPGYGQQPNYGGQPGYGAPQGGNFQAGDILTYLVEGIKHPIASLRRAYESPNGTPMFILGGIHLALVFVLPLLVINMLLNSLSHGYIKSGGSGAGTFALYCVIYAAVSRFMTALFAMIAGDSGTPYTKTLAASCQATVQFMLYNVIAGVFGLLGTFALIISYAVLAVKTVLIAPILDYETIKVNTQNKDKAFMLFVINEIVIVVIMSIFSLIIGANMAQNLQSMF